MRSWIFHTTQKSVLKPRYVLSVGWQNSPTFIIDVLQVDVDGNGTLDLSEFMQFMNSHFCAWNPANDLEAVFRLLDRKVKVEEL